jgi:hypothetical protein
MKNNFFETMEFFKIAIFGVSSKFTFNDIKQLYKIYCHRFGKDNVDFEIKREISNKKIGKFFYSNILKMLEQGEVIK